MSNSNTENKRKTVDRVVIKRPPSPREVYWIAAPEGAKEPEFTGFHPGIIIRGCKSLSEITSTVIFIPITSREHVKDENGKYPPHIVELSANPNPNSDCRVWAVCSHVMTTNLTRLRAFRTDDGFRVPKLSQDDFQRVLDGVLWNQGALRNHVEHLLNDLVDKALQEHEAEIEAYKAKLEEDFDQRVEERALELARRMVAENNFHPTL